MNLSKIICKDCKPLGKNNRSAALISVGQLQHLNKCTSISDRNVESRILKTWMIFHSHISSNHSNECLFQTEMFFVSFEFLSVFPYFSWKRHVLSDVLLMPWKDCEFLWVLWIFVIKSYLYEWHGLAKLNYLITLCTVRKQFWQY